MTIRRVLSLAALCPLLFASAAAAADHVVEAGQTLALKNDLVLEGNDTLDIKGTPDQRCTLQGNGFRIRTADKWTGSLTIRHCDIRKLGAAAKLADDGSCIAAEYPALDVKARGAAAVVLEHCLFEESSSVHLQNDGDSTAALRHNTFSENTLVRVDKDVGKSLPCVSARGSSKAPKFFQGNRIYRAQARFAAPNWLVGGDTDADSNLCIGIRIGLFGEGDGTILRGNYLHLRMPITKEFPYYSQVSTFSTSKGALGEHNIIRDGEWIVRFIEGEFRYNVITDINDHDLMQQGSTGKIHHNIFSAGSSDSRMGSMMGCIAIVYPPKNPGEGAEIYNNVFDGGGKLDVPGIEVSEKGFVKSLRNNVFFNFALKDRYYKTPHAIVRPAWNEDFKDKPARLGYADYNLFYNPLAKSKHNYLLSVEGKTERKDAGFGLHDVPKGGSVDDQVDPKFKGPIPKAFPFETDAIKAGKVTVSQMLAHFRDVYTPAEGSPLLGAGDPADGVGINIGAVGAAKPHPLDRFGTFGKLK